MATDDAFEERTIGDWTAYQDDEGRTYYYNNETEESSWDPPPGFEAGGGCGDAALSDDDGVGARDDAGEGVSPPYAATPVDDKDGITRSPGDDNDVITRSPMDEEDDGITRSPPINHDAEEETTTTNNNNSDNFEQGGDADVEEEDNQAVDGEDIGDGWIAYKDDEGRTYYYNADSGETQWERPDVVASSSIAKDTTSSDNAAAEEGDYYSDGETGATPTSDGEEEGDGDITSSGGEAKDKTSKAQLHQQEDPATIAENFLQQPDAIMEPSVMDHISTLVNKEGAQVGFPKAVQSLINGYQGDTAMCGVMGLWLAELKSSGGAAGAEGGKGGGGGRSISDVGANEVESESDRFNQGADAARDVAEEVVNRLAKERFTKNGGDAIMSLSKKQAAFVDEMIQSERWRNLLVSSWLWCVYYFYFN
jgi:hypothetical protein